MKDKKILIVGGAGYIGGYLTDCLIANQYNITVFDNLIYETRFLKKVPFIYGDIRDKKLLQKILPNFNVVIWLAAIVGDGACAVDPVLSQTINEDMVKWVVDHYSGKFIFTSTCSVYGINNDLIDEQAEPHPLSVYAATKLNAERYIIQKAKDYLVFRLGTLYGLSDEHSRVRFDLVANVLVKRAAQGETLIVFGGEQWRPLLHVKDVTTAILFGLENNIQGLYNLSAGNYKISDIAYAIKQLFNDVKIEWVDKKFEDLRNYRVKGDAFMQYGWQPRHTIDEGITEIYNIINEGRIVDVADPAYSNEFYLRKNIHILSEEGE